VSGWLSAPFVQAVVNGAYDHEYTVSAGPQWTHVHRDVPLPDHGWKLHVSTRAATLADLAATLVPYLLAEGHTFKLAAGSDVLAMMNQGFEMPALVGKACTIYPTPDRVRDLGLALADLLRGHAGPRVLSDRQVDPHAPVYYRYGPFVHRWFRGERGVMEVRIPGPDGQHFDALAELHYRQPDWVTDPFQDSTHAAPAGLIGGRYRVERGLQRAAPGNVFRGTDVSCGQRVIVKQARPYVGDPGDGTDARTRLRNERRVLAALDALDGVPRFLDHVAHGDDEFLVTTDLGDSNLQLRVLTGGGLLRPDAPMPPLLTCLARRLATIVGGLHARDVVMRDITPRNVVLDGDRAGLVDFGISALGGLHPRGGTHGFAPSRQMNLAPAEPADDAHGLGMTLAFAATGLLPVIGETEPGLAAARMRDSLAAVYEDAHRPFVALLTDLISGDPATALAALAALAQPVWPEPAQRRIAHAVPAAVPDLERHVLDLVLDLAPARLLDQPASAFAAIDGSLYTGSAGLGLELLHHRDRPGVDDLLRRLGEHAATANQRTAPPPGLYLGATGTHLFLAALHDAGFEVPVPPLPVTPYPTEDEHDDIITGTAGCGIGYLLLGAEDAGRRCADRLIAGGEMRLSVTAEATPSTDPASSYSHGRAGVLGLLLTLAARTGDAGLRDEAAKRAGDLAARTEDLIARAAAPGAIPLAASWCQGLAGIGRTMLHAGTVLGEQAYTALALAAADTCAGWVPRMQNPGQCCGLAGVGGFLIDCARHTGEPDRHRQAQEVARQLLRRSHGPDDAPLLLDPDRQDAPLSWASGYGGILTFLRRLNHPGTPELVPAGPGVSGGAG
jgi:serine/threonine protein kinase